MSETSETATRNDFDLITETLQTHIQIKENHSYELLSHKSGFAKVSLKTKLTEKIDDTNYVYEASIFSCANFCAMAAVNTKGNHLISAKAEFLSPVKTTDKEVVFEAVATTNSSGKKQVKVVGTVNDLIVFEGSFITLKLDGKSIVK